MSYEIGSRIGDYEILEVLGAGGMGRVYKVRNLISDRVEAMKVLLPDLEGNPDLADRFMREIKVQASLDHPNIAALHTALRANNQLVMLMEYVEGTTLDRMMESGPVPIDKAADYIAQVLSALSYAHARGIIHRDLKPANMMVTASGLVKLMDFGIAKMTADRKLTQTGSTVGSLYYMSPEQIKGATDLDPRSDLYSIGVSLYEIVTGARPFQGDSEYSIMAAHLQGHPPPPVQVSPNLPPGLNEIILQALETEPARRFQNADAFRAALLHVCKPGQAAAAIPPRPVVKNSEPAQNVKPVVQAVASADRPARANRGLWIALGAVIVIVVIVVAAMQLPKFRRTAAVDLPAQALVPTPAAESQTAESKPIADSVNPPAAPESFTTQPSGSAQPSQPAATAAQALSPAPSKAARTASASLSYPSSAARQPVQESPRLEPSQPAPQTVAALAEDPKTVAQLKELNEQLDLLSIRAGTVKGSLDKLRRQQSSSGLSLRADMASAAQRMELYLSQTETALKRRDADAAKKSLDMAEREVSKLEDFLHQ